MDPILGRWLLGRRPPIPLAFLPHLVGAEEGEDPPGGLVPTADESDAGPRGSSSGSGERFVGPLSDLAFSALADASLSPGRTRDTAFRLLAGDAFLTYACEASLEDDHAREVLAGLLAGVGARLG